MTVLAALCVPASGEVAWTAKDDTAQLLDRQAAAGRSLGRLLGAHEELDPQLAVQRSTTVNSALAVNILTTIRGMHVDNPAAAVEARS